MSEKETGMVNEIFSQASEEINRRSWVLEEVIRNSRDITFESKRIITILQRYQQEVTESGNVRQDQGRNRRSALTEAEEKVELLRKHNFQRLLKLIRPMNDPEYLNHHMSVSHCLQEFIECLAFLKFIKYRKVLSLEDVQALLTYSLSAETGQSGEPEIIPVSCQDYMLGMADFIGELMRTVPSITSSTFIYKGTENKELLITILAVSQDLFQKLQGIWPCPPDLQGKMEVMRSNVMKMEKGLYEIRLREHELVQNPNLLQAFLDRQQL